MTLAPPILLFAGMDYYPSGGARDLVVSAQTLDDALVQFAAVLAANQRDYEWINVFDASRQVSPRATWRLMNEDEALRWGGDLEIDPRLPAHQPKQFRWSRYEDLKPKYWYFDDDD